MKKSEVGSRKSEIALAVPGRSYGTVMLSPGHREPSWFVIEAPPQTLLRLKALFPRIDKGELGQVRLVYSAETCVDLLWFMQRYPMKVGAPTMKAIEEGAGSHQAMLSDLDQFLSPDYVPPVRALAKPLRDYQARGVELHLRGKRLLLGDQLGLGKTVSAIGSFTEASTLPALVIAPTHLCEQWVAKVNEFLPTLRTHIIKGVKTYTLPTADVYVTTYSRIAAWGEVLCAFGFKSVVFDECQELRRDESLKWKASKGVAQRCDYALGMSATPVYNYGGEIYNVLEVIAPGRIGGRQEFYREWCVSVGNGRWKLREPEIFREFLLEQRLMLRRTRPEVGLELPKVERHVETVPHDEGALAEAESSATELAKLVLSAGFHDSGVAARRLDNVLRQATGIAKAAYVADFVRMLVESGEKVILFGWHREVYDIWMERLGPDKDAPRWIVARHPGNDADGKPFKAGDKVFYYPGWKKFLTGAAAEHAAEVTADCRKNDLRPLLYTGTESPKEKAEAIKRFLDPDPDTGSQVMIMSLRSGSGVDGLQAVCNVCVFGELDWSPGVHEQCIGRLNRDGLIRGALVYFLVSEGGSDPAVADALQLKKAQVEGVMDGVQTELENLEVDPNRVRKLAEAYLKARGVEVPARSEVNHGGHGE